MGKRDITTRPIKTLMKLQMICTEDPNKAGSKKTEKEKRLISDKE